MRFALFALALLGALPAQAALTVYTDRPTARVEAVAKKFTAATGEAVTLVELGYGELLKKLQAEGAASPADVIFVKDMVYLADLSSQGFFQPLQSDLARSSVVDALRDPQGLWTAISMRARTIVYAPGRVQPNELSTYEDLGANTWAGRLCLRTSVSSYNDALVGSLIAQHGYDRAKEIVGAWVANLATAPQANDTAVIEAIANGVCDVGVVNTYYLAQVLAKAPSFPVKVFFANQADRGVHVNGSGAGVAKTSKQPALAARFIETMYDDEIQLFLSGSHYEYPAKRGLAPNTLIKDWGTFRIDSRNWSESGANGANARKLTKEVGYL